MRQLAYVLRSLRRSPRFAATVVSMLGLGMGAGAALFTLIDQLLLRPPAHVEAPDRVRRLVLEETGPSGPYTSTSLAWVDYEAVREHAETIERVAGWSMYTWSLGRGEGARNITVALATASIFPTLGVLPELGRFFTPEEDSDTATRIPCVAGYELWRRDLGGDGSALGRRLVVGGVSCTVVGVTPRGFSGLEVRAVDLWLPVRAAMPVHDPDPRLWTTDRSHWLRVVGRLAPGVAVERANQDATLAYRTFPDRQRDPELESAAGWEPIIAGRWVRSSTVDVSTLLFAGGLLLLLLILANLVNLFLVRELERGRETAVRLALGCSRRRLFGLRVVESGVLAAGAALVGLAVAFWLAPLIRRFLLGGLEFASGALSLRVALLTFVVALGVGVAIAAVATWRLGRGDPADVLRGAGSGRSGEARRTRWTRQMLVGFQAGLSAALVLGSIAFLQSFRRALDVDLGFEHENVIVAQVAVSAEGYDREAERAFYREARERARAMPGVASASLGYMTPWWNNRNERISIPGRDTLPLVPNFGSPAFDAVTPDYLETMGLRVREGRWITGEDRAGAPPVVVINASLAALYWPGEAALGRCMVIGDVPDCRTVVGIVDDHRFSGGIDARPVGAYFLPIAQAGPYRWVPRLFVRTDGPAESVTPGLSAMLQTLAPNLPAADVVPLSDRFEPLVASWRIGSYAFTALGILATLVGSLGLFSVLSFVVAERKREFAIRSAIGARAGQIAVPVVRNGVTTVLLGVAAGGLTAWMARPWVQPLLYETRLASPIALLLMVAGLGALAAAASLGPARAAASQDPMELLRLD